MSPLVSFASTRLEAVLEVPAPLLHYAGLSLLPFGALVALLSTRETLPRRAIWAVILWRDYLAGARQR